MRASSSAGARGLRWSGRRAFYDASYALPPAMLESYIEKWPAPRLDDFMYMLRSGMMGWMTILLETTTWTPKSTMQRGTPSLSTRSSCAR